MRGDGINSLEKKKVAWMPLDWMDSWSTSSRFYHIELGSSIIRYASTLVQRRAMDVCHKVPGTVDH
jgi:hypothetical protein